MNKIKEFSFCNLQTFCGIESLSLSITRYNQTQGYTCIFRLTAKRNRKLYDTKYKCMLYTVKMYKAPETSGENFTENNCSHKNIIFSRFHRTLFYVGIYLQFLHISLFLRDIIVQSTQYNVFEFQLTRN